MSIWIVSTILIVTLTLLVTEKLPVDVTAIGIVVALMLTRILSPVEAVAGLANPAVITVGSMFLVSRGMIRTGAVEFIGSGAAVEGYDQLAPADVVMISAPFTSSRSIFRVACPFAR